MPARSVAAFAADALVSGYEGGVQVEIGKHPALHYEASSPQPLVSSGGVVAAPSRSAFQSNLLVVKVRSLLVQSLN
jgi:hypothetical protein